MARTRFHERLGAFGITAAIGVMGAGALARSCAPPTPTAPAAKASKAPKAAISAPLPVAGAVVNLVNEQRAAAGIAPVAESVQLDAAAVGQSSDQATRRTMTHLGSNGSSGGARMSYLGFKWSAWGENVAAGQTTAEQVMDAWMNSPAHRANILNAAYTNIGVAAVGGGDGVTYWTMDLATPR